MINRQYTTKRMVWFISLKWVKGGFQVLAGGGDYNTKSIKAKSIFVFYLSGHLEVAIEMTIAESSLYMYIYVYLFL